MITIENEHLKVELNPLGAELNSLIDKRDGVEHMWSADPKFWPRKAPILFPCVGESKDGVVSFDGNEYSMQRHGFTRTQVFDCVEQNTKSAAFVLHENEETLKSYPFSFRFEVEYHLSGNALEHRFTLTNTGDATLGYQLGGHPAFAVPFSDDEQFSDYCIRFDQSMKLKRHLLNDAGLYSGETRTVLDSEDQIPLDYELFNEDALVFKNIPSKLVWIQSKAGGKKLRVDFAEFPHLGIWSKPGADYVCLEPWIGCADDHDQKPDFLNKDSIQLLDPGTSRTATFSVQIVH
jgi:galactose mutarotase-like enzyme